MKTIYWCGTSYKDLKALPKDAQRVMGRQLDKVQRNLDPSDWKPMSSIGPGVREIRVHLDNEYRTIYTLKHKDSIYVLHVFTKKTQKTSKKDIDLAKERFRQYVK